MSTKSTIIYGDGFHLYTELFDGKHVFLELSAVEFIATPGAVTVAIPLPVWECIREYQAQNREGCWLLEDN